MTDNVIEVQIKVTGAGGQEVVDTITSSLQGLGDQAKESLGPINDDLDTMTGAARLEMFQTLATTGAQAFATIAAAAQEFVDIAAESELVVARLDMKMQGMGKQIGMTTDEVVALGDELAAASTFDDEEIISGMSKLLAFGELNEEQFRRASRIAVALSAETGMGITEAFSAVGRSLEAPEQGFGRLWREIGKLDPAQQAAIKSAIKLGDTLKAQELLLKGYEERPAYLTAIEKFASSYTGQMQGVELATENFKESVGNGMLPALKSIPMPAKVAGSIIGDLGKTLLDCGIQVYFFAQAVKVLTGSGGIAAIGAGVGKAIGAIGGFGGAFSFLSAVIHGTLLSIAGAIGGIIATITLPMILLAAAVIAFAVILYTQWDHIKEGFLMVADFIAAVINRIADELINSNSIFNNWMINLGQRFKNWITSLTNTAGQLAIIFQGVGKRIVEGIWAGIQGGWEWLKTNISNSMKTLLEWVKKQLGIKSPSMVFALEVGQPMAQGMAQGFAQGIQSNLGGFASAAMSIPSAARGAIPAMAMAGGNTRVDHLSIHYRTSPQERRYFDRRAERISERALERLIE